MDVHKIYQSLCQWLWAPKPSLATSRKRQKSTRHALEHTHQLPSSYTRSDESWKSIVDAHLHELTSPDTEGELTETLRSYHIACICATIEAHASIHSIIKEQIVELLREQNKGVARVELHEKIQSNLRQPLEFLIDVLLAELYAERKIVCTENREHFAPI